MRERDDPGMAPRTLSSADRYYLRENLPLSVDMGPTDPQAQRVYAVDSNVIDHDTPVWARDVVRERIEGIARAHDLHIKTVIRDQCINHAFVGRGGGVVHLRTRGGGEWRSAPPGAHFASIVLHECAHILTPHLFVRSDRYGTRAFQSHGPEFVAVYLHLLSGWMDTTRAQEGFALLGVEVATLPEGTR